MLTEKRIEKLAPPAGVQELNVRDEPGLVLRVRRNGDGSVSRSWAFWRVRGGKKERAKIGAWPAIELIEARRQADHFRKLASCGVRVTKEIAPTTAATSLKTVGDLFDLWLKMYATPRHKDGGKRVRWLLDKHAGVIRSVPLAALTKQHITLTVLPLVGQSTTRPRPTSSPSSTRSPPSRPGTTSSPRTRLARCAAPTSCRLTTRRGSGRWTKPN